MFCDLAEERELQTGLRSEGTLMATSTLVAKTASGVGLFLSGILLAQIGFPRGAAPGQVDPGILSSLALHFVLLMGALTVVSLLSLGRFRMQQADHERHLHELGLLERSPVQTGK
jgi:GPH family glycoside/pentoside/hexuronide:cation symporter